MAEPRAADVLVIGGGVMGCSAALELARRGLSVALLERRRVGWAASGRNAGAIRAHGRNHHELPLALASREQWAAYAAEDACLDFHFARDGDLVVGFTEAEERRLEASARWYTAQGLGVEVLRGEALTRAFPFLSREVRAAAHCPSDALAYPLLAVRALAALARSAGARLVEQTAVTGLARDGDRVIGVETSGGRWSAGHVVNAAGPWAGELAALAGLHVPVVPRRSQILVTERVASTVKPFVSGRGIYVRQSPYGNLIVGGGGAWESIGYDQAGTAPTLHRLASRLLWMCPGLGHLRVIRGWAGTVELTPDHRPHLGPTPSAPGLWLAAGFCGNGFAVGPVAGRVIAELIVDGRSAFDLRPFAPERFPPGRDYRAELQARSDALTEPVHVAGAAG